MKRLPVIVGFGGYNSAGRSSGHNGYRRLILESLGSKEVAETVTSLASLMGLVSWEAGGFRDRHGVLSEVDLAEKYTESVVMGSLIRRIEPHLFAVDNVAVGKSLRLEASIEQPLIFHVASRSLPDPIPSGWQVVPTASGYRVEVTAPQEFLLDSRQALPVQSAGQLPTGFDPGALYRSQHHPRGLQLAVTGAADALHSVGIPWAQIITKVRPDEVAVYSSSVMSQLDNSGFGGMIKARVKGGRATSKQLALGLNTMSADFVNAYVLGNVGATGGVTGACATFLYNLRMGVEEIKAGRRRVVMVGSSEAPILPEIIDGYAAMGALATDMELRKLDSVAVADHRRSSRPFGENCGFTLAEASQWVVLMDDALALELGADIHGSVPGVYINADGFKKSISAPGPGNCVTMGKAVGLAKTLLGDAAVRHRSFVQAHGSSTPQNRVTESRLLDKIAEVFDIPSWPVAAVKAYLGHSLGPASGDQLAASLGIFAHGILPGIKTIDRVAEDVHHTRLRIETRDVDLGIANCDISFINSKGFGGNNATGTVFSPAVTSQLLEKRHGKTAMSQYFGRRDGVRDQAMAYQCQAMRGEFNVLYQFGDSLIDEEAMEWTQDHLKVPGFEQLISLADDEGFGDLREI